MKVCPKCGREYPDDLYFCRKCFEHLEPASELPEQSKSAVPAESTPEPKPEPKPAEPHKKPDQPHKIEIKSIEMEVIDDGEPEESTVPECDDCSDKVGPPWKGSCGCFMFFFWIIVSYLIFKYILEMVS